MKNIYNKKGFKSGLFFLFLAIATTITLMLRWNKLRPEIITRDIVTTIITYLIAVSSISRSFSYHHSEEDSREDDERSKLVELNAQSKSFVICFRGCMILNILIILVYVITRVEEILFIYIPFGIMFGIMFITMLISFFYYDNKF